jgi:hypothetical protein
MTINATSPAVLGALEPNNGVGLPDLSIVQNLMDCVNGDQAVNQMTFSATGPTIGSTVLGESMVQSISQAANASAVGAVAQPVSGSVACAISKVGSIVTLVFTFTAARIAVTDGAASGSFGATKIFDFVEQALAFIGSRYNQVSSVEGAALTTGAGDAAYVIGIGTTAIAAAADGVLAAANTNVSGGSKSITDVAGTGAGELVAVPAVATAGVDGTGTASDLYLNWSGTAATIDASSTIDITGTATVVLAMLGDD